MQDVRAPPSEMFWPAWTCLSTIAARGYSQDQCSPKDQSPCHARQNFSQQNTAASGPNCFPDRDRDRLHGKRWGMQGHQGAHRRRP